MAHVCVERRDADRILVCTVAAGHGDVTFGANVVCAWLATDASARVCVAVVAQAGTRPQDAAARLCSTVCSLLQCAGMTPLPTLLVGAFLREGSRAVAAAAPSWRAVRLGESACEDADAVMWVRSTADVVVEGPLLLHTPSPRDAFVRALRDELYLECAPRVCVVTREMGQAAFCYRTSTHLNEMTASYKNSVLHALRGVAGASTPPAVAEEHAAPFQPFLHLDVSTGLSLDDVGVFTRLVMPPGAIVSVVRRDAADATEASSARTCVTGHVFTHTRTQSHMRVAVRMLLQRVGQPRDGADDGVHFVLMGPRVDAAMLQREADRVCGGDAAVDAEEAADWTVCIDVARAPGKTARQLCVPYSSFRLAFGPVSSRRRVRLHCVELAPLGLDVLACRSLLTSDTLMGCVVTGDASLNEALCARVPFWYSAEPHKRDVVAGLNFVVKRGRRLSICEWWEWLVSTDAGTMHTVPPKDDWQACFNELTSVEELLTSAYCSVAVTVLPAPV